MRFVSSNEQTRRLEHLCDREAGVSSLTLMEIAARAVVRRIVGERWNRTGPTVVVCGPGNNGGDGYAVARGLLGLGVDVRVVEALPPKTASCIHQREALARCGLPVHSARGDSLEGHGVVVDAVFGAGLSRPLEGEVGALVERMARAGDLRVAVDLPSGVHGDGGAPRGPYFRADHTLMLGHYKPAAFLPPASAAMGVVWLEELGFAALPQLRTEEKVHDLILGEVPDGEDLYPLIPARRLDAHKGDAGHLLVVAGHPTMIGASVLACQAAFAAGVGQVTLAAPSRSWPALRGLPPEVMVQEPSQLYEPGFCEGFDGVVAGPGLRIEELQPETRAALAEIWSGAAIPVLFDAGALPLVNPAPLEVASPRASGKRVAQRLITPHPGEAARLLETTTAEVQQDRMGAARRLSRHHAALLKGPHTLVGAPGHHLSINTAGGPALATAGSGDVLAGMCGALMARGMEARDAARVGAFVHGRAGERLPLEGATAGDLCPAISSILTECAS